ncbi:glycoside hydrolase superfamily [Mycena maculata]|uniref:mannan endo-1,4-beta-mannosidase n=1 Tax=Mycena maculata TaxID=230809 RepID=A0AAD7MPF4_9AGAR|nr:glycoside hydrolase superfamily [Mycena maculata]
MQVIFLSVALLLSTSISQGAPLASSGGSVPSAGDKPTTSTASSPHASGVISSNTTAPGSNTTAPGGNTTASIGNLTAPAGNGSTSMWVGGNNYYAYALPAQERYALLDGMKASGMKVLRTWVSGAAAGQKGSDNIDVPDLEANGIGRYDDTILTAIDQLMVDAHDRGIKLLIGMYDQNVLKANDTYGKTYTPQGFYTNPAAMTAFSNRIKYILTTHQNKLVGNQPWSALSSYIFGLEAQNEPMIFLPQSFQEQNWGWICNASQMIRSNVADKNIVILSGGNDAKESVQPLFLESSCPVDVVSIHDYDSDFSTWMPDAITQAKTAGKRLLVEEWGSLVGSDRETQLASNIKALASIGVPWLYWEYITNKDPGQSDDFEIEVNGTDWSVVANAAAAASTATNGVFDFSDALAL